MTTPYLSSDPIPVAPADSNTIDSLLGGTRWAGSTITYSFPFSNDPAYWSTDTWTGYGLPGGDGEPWESSVAPLTDSDKVNFEKALQQWANVANVSFSPITETTSNVGDIRAAYTGDPDTGTLAWSYLPGYSVRSGDIWANSQSLLNDQKWTPGSISFETILHEIGHALGLKHPFLDPDDPAAAVLPTSLDAVIHTVMSYTVANLDGEKGSRFSFYPTTPMVLDIAAIQYLYGANNNYHTGNDTYTYDDITLAHETIWDAGGIDTIHYTGTTSAIIDLNPAGTSYIGQPVYVQSKGANLGLPVPNVWIAEGAIIENAIGGQADDFMFGNTSRNTLDGGAGIDTVMVESQLNQNTVTQTADGYAITFNSTLHNQDSLINIERLEFSDVKLALDLGGHAGQVAKLLGAVFGPATITNRQYIGVGLTVADEGLSYEKLAEFAVDARNLTSSDEIVTTLWNNLFGTMPSDSEKAPYVKQLDTGELSIGALTILAADSGYNTGNINLVGLTQTGIAFV